MSEFGEKEFPGVGYPTPVSIPDETTCLTLQVPADPEWWALAVGLLYTLTQQANWQQFEGGMSREDAAERWTTMFDEAVELAARLEDECYEKCDTPFWDDLDGADADDCAEEDYGKLNEEQTLFIAAVALWVIIAFVATTATAGAAIAFIPEATEFALEFIASPAGAPAIVWINGTIIAAVDTYAATTAVISLPVVAGAVLAGMGAADTINTLWISMGSDINPAVVGTPTLQVVRKRLWAGEVIPENVRYNEDCNCIQTTPDGGTTWINNPAADPRHADAARKPPLTGDDAQCNAAARIVAAWQETLETLYQTANAAQFATGVLEALLLLAGGAGVLVDLIILAFYALITIGVSNIEAAFTSDVWHGVECIIDCNIGSNGQVSADQAAAILAQIAAQYPGTVYNTLVELENLFGEVLMSNAGVERSELGNCDDCLCNWDFKWNFAEGLGDWSIVWGTLVAEGVLMADSQGGWPSVARVDLTVAIPSGSHLTGLRMWYCDPTGDSGFTSYGVHGYGEGGGEYWEINNGAAPNGNMSISSDNTGTLHLTVFCTYGSTGRTARITGVEMTGDGDPPALTSLASTWPPATTC